MVRIYVVCQEETGIPIAFYRTKARAEKWIIDVTNPGGKFDYMKHSDYWVEDRELIDE